jgi:integrase
VVVKKRSRRGAGEGSIFKDGRGLWTAVIELPRYEDGKRRKKTVRSKDKRVVLAKLQELQAEKKKSGDLPTRDITVAEWMYYWFENVCILETVPKTSNNYKSLIKNHIIPHVGSIKLGKLTTTDIRNMCNAITAAGKSSTTALQVFRILSGALTVAMQDGKVPRNVAKAMKAPRKAVAALDALTVDQSIQVLRTAVDDPYEALWFAIFLTTARQGELCGLEVDRVNDSIEVSWQLQRLTWQHGCNPRCGWAYGARCEQRKINAPADYELRHITGGLWLTRPKSKAGYRVIPMADILAAAMQRQLERDAAIPNPHGLVFRNADGSPLEPRKVQDLWHDLLKRAGVPDIRFHDGRHTAIDLLYEAGVPEDLIIEIAGHSAKGQSRSYKAKGNKTRLSGAVGQVAALVNLPNDGRSGTSASIAS